MLLRKNVVDISIQKLTAIVVIVLVVDSKKQTFFFLKKAEMAEKSAFWMHIQILGCRKTKVLANCPVFYLV